MAKTFDPRRNMEAVTHFLEVVNAPERPEEETGPAPAERGENSAAAQLLRTLRDEGSAPLDAAMWHSRLDMLSFSETLARLQRAGLVTLLRDAAAEHELLTLTSDGQRLARLIDDTSAGHAV